jgi:hypothetical protein
MIDGRNPIAVHCAPNIGTQGLKAPGGGFNIPVGFRADQGGIVVRKGGSDQVSVSLGFGRDGCQSALEPSRLNGNVHIKDLLR